MSVNITQIVPMFDFSKIPGAVKITGAEKVTFDEMLAFEPPGHPIYVAPDLPFFMSLTFINIPSINFNDLTNLLEGVLANTEKIEISKKNQCFYEIEFHPVSGIKIYPYEKTHKMKWWSSMHAATSALKKFPQLEPDFYDIQNIPLPVFRDEWFKMDLRIYYSTKNDCYMLEFYRMRGEAISFYKIFNQIKVQIKSVFNTPNLFWLMRKNYINLFEGTQISKKDENQITQYLLNDLLLREICTYIGIGEETAN